MKAIDPIVLGGHRTDDRSQVFGDLPHDPPDGRRYLRNVTVPTLTAYLPEPDAATGTGIVVVPGGALHILSIDNEGTWVAERLVERGIAAFVLHYRVVATPVPDEEFFALTARVFAEPTYLTDIGAAARPGAVEDGGSAVRLVRERAREWRVRADRVGMLGFSAGGFVAAATALDAEPDARPSFVAPIYPAVWGDVVAPDPAPPMFLAWASDDEVGDVIVESALHLYDVWRRAGASVEAHAYATGGHGFGMTSRGTPSDRWFADFSDWLAASGF
jgi:acetyl esterase/lipase